MANTGKGLWGHRKRAKHRSHLGATALIQLVWVNRTAMEEDEEEEEMSVLDAGFPVRQVGLYSG